MHAIVARTAEVGKRETKPFPGVISLSSSMTTSAVSSVGGTIVPNAEYMSTASVNVAEAILRGVDGMRYLSECDATATDCLRYARLAMQRFCDVAEPVGRKSGPMSAQESASTKNASTECEFVGSTWSPPRRLGKCMVDDSTFAVARGAINMTTAVAKRMKAVGDGEASTVVRSCDCVVVFAAAVVLRYMRAEECETVLQG
jgi:hypothetical protein